MGWLLGAAHGQVASVPLGIPAVERSAPKLASPVSPLAEPATSFTLAQAVLQSPHEPSVCAFADETYAAGNWELQFLAGGYFKSSLGPKAPEFDYLPISVRLGRIWTAPHFEAPRLLAGLETLLELSAAPITSGPGSYFAGPSLLLRQNFLCRPGQRWIPYIQGGAGIAFTDAGDDRTQRAVGQNMEFLLQAQLGLRARLNQNWTFDVEVGLQHISNAGLADRNGGINAVGAAIGFTYTLPCRR